MPPRWCKINGSRIQCAEAKGEGQRRPGSVPSAGHSAVKDQKWNGGMDEWEEKARKQGSCSPTIGTGGVLQAH